MIEKFEEWLANDSADRKGYFISWVKNGPRSALVLFLLTSVSRQSGIVFVLYSVPSLSTQCISLKPLILLDFCRYVFRSFQSEIIWLIRQVIRIRTSDCSVIVPSGHRVLQSSCHSNSSIVVSFEHLLIRSSGYSNILLLSRRSIETSSELFVVSLACRLDTVA